MRGCRTLIMLLLSSVLLTGCWDRTEINDLAIVLATGVDYKDGQAQLTAQIFIPRKGGEARRAAEPAKAQGGSL